MTVLNPEVEIPARFKTAFDKKKYTFINKICIYRRLFHINHNKLEDLIVVGAQVITSIYKMRGNKIQFNGKIIESGFGS